MNFLRHRYRQHHTHFPPPCCVRSGTGTNRIYNQQAAAEQEALEHRLKTLEDKKLAEEGEQAGRGNPGEGQGGGRDDDGSAAEAAAAAEQEAKKAKPSSPTTGKEKKKKAGVKKSKAQQVRERALGPIASLEFMQYSAISTRFQPHHRHRHLHNHNNHPVDHVPLLLAWCQHHIFITIRIICRQLSVF